MVNHKNILLLLSVLQTTIAKSYQNKKTASRLTFGNTTALLSQNTLFSGVLFGDFPFPSYLKVE